MRALCPLSGEPLEGIYGRRPPLPGPLSATRRPWPRQFLDPQLPAPAWPGSGRWPSALEAESRSPSSGEAWGCPWCGCSLWDGPSLLEGLGRRGPPGAPGTAAWPGQRPRGPTVTPAVFPAPSAWWASGHLTHVPSSSCAYRSAIKHPSCQWGPDTQPQGRLVQWAPVPRARASGAASSLPPARGATKQPDLTSCPGEGTTEGGACAARRGCSRRRHLTPGLPPSIPPPRPTAGPSVLRQHDGAGPRPPSPRGLWEPEWCRLWGVTPGGTVPLKL